MDDGLGGVLVEQAREGLGIREIARDRQRAGRGQPAPVGGDDGKAPLVKQRRQAPPEQAARPGDQDAQPWPQPVMTAPPFTASTWPWR